MLSLHVSGQYIRDYVFTQVNVIVNNEHFFRSVFIQPGTNHRPDGGKDTRSVDDQADAQSLGVVFAQKPDQVLNQLIIHAGSAEVLEVEDNTQIVYHLFETPFAGGFQAMYYKLR